MSYKSGIVSYIPVRKYNNEKYYLNVMEKLPNMARPKLKLLLYISDQYYSLRFFLKFSRQSITLNYIFIIGLLDIQNITYDTTTGVVTCVSTGGPVTTLTWNRRGGSYSPSKIVMDTVSATYHNLLSISGNTLSDYTGIFSCTVSNSRGTTYLTTAEFKGM